MNILITENQKKILIKESLSDTISNVVNDSYDMTKKIIEKASNQMKLDLKFSITWGATIGGLIGPINDFVSGKFPELNDVEVNLLLTGVISNYFFDNQKLINEVFDKIKESGLFDTFKLVLKKAETFKKVFVSFIDSLNITLHKVTNIMSYSFIIPLIPILYDGVVSGNLKQTDAKEITVRLLSFGVLTISGILLNELISKLIQRFGSGK